MSASTCASAVQPRQTASTAPPTSQTLLKKDPPGIVVVDLASGQAWRKLDDTPSVKPEPGFVMFAEGRPGLQNRTGPAHQARHFRQRLPGHLRRRQQALLLPRLSHQALQHCHRVAFATAPSAPRPQPPKSLSSPARKAQTAWESDAAGAIYSTAPASSSILKSHPTRYLQAALRLPRSSTIPPPLAGHHVPGRRRLPLRQRQPALQTSPPCTRAKTSARNPTCSSASR